jgi:hypothetical protein
VIKANDGNPSTYWEGAANAYPNWIRVDLGGVSNVNKVVLKLPSAWGARTQTLSVSGSMDDTAYTTIVASAAYAFSPSANTVTINFLTTSARYIKLNFTANNGSTGAQVSEFEVYGSLSGGTNCTASSLVAAMGIGGVVIMDCGTSPITIDISNFQVIKATELKPVVPNSITIISSMSRAFTVNPGVSFTVNELNFRGLGVPGIHDGAIFSSGILTINNSKFSKFGGFAVSSHGTNAAIHVNDSAFFNNGVGAAPVDSCIYVEGGALTVANSTFNDNRASSGVIFAFSETASISNSTFSNNTSLSSGSHSVIINGLNGQTSITNSTFSGNESAITSVFPITVTNSIIETNFVESDCSNVVGSGNIQWPLNSPSCGSSFHYADPKLAPLANNGGSTMTMALLPGSAAIDSALAPFPAADQRGVSRPRDGDNNGSAIADVGAFEVSP